MSFIKQIEVNKSIRDLDFNDYTQSAATVLLNVHDIDRDSFEAFATKHYNYLPYDNRPSYGFTGDAQDEVSPHFDGVSADDPRKVPEWLFFWAASEIEEGIGGDYKVCDCTAVEKDPALLKQLQGVRQQFVNYNASVKEGNGRDEFSFPVLQTYRGHQCLRVFLDASDKDIRKVPGVQTKFIGADGQDHEELRKPIHDLYEDKNNYQYVRLERQNLLIVNNVLCFHGRARLQRISNRLFYRVQSLAA